MALTVLSIMTATTTARFVREDSNSVTNCNRLIEVCDADSTALVFGYPSLKKVLDTPSVTEIEVIEGFIKQYN